MESNYSESIVEKILFEPVFAGANRLCITTAHATPSMASWLLTTYAERDIGDVSIELVIESVADDGIDYNSHEGFKELQREYSGSGRGKFICSYLYQPPASNKNSYIWLQDEKPMQAFNCSYDFTQDSLLRMRRGSMNVRAAAYAYRHFGKIIDRTIYCNHSEVEDYVVIRHTDSLLSTGGSSLESCVLSFLTRTGEPGTKSGLNWGQRKKRNKNEAYIPLSREVARGGFFPLNNQHFLVVTDDHHTLQLRVEQQNDKAITTPSSNALLGEYFRNRLGLANGAYVSLDDLKSYGRTDVTFYKIDDEQYYMDFSVEVRGRNSG